MAVKNETSVKVRNLVDHPVGYRIDEDRVRRVFAAYEVKDIEAGELRKLNYQHGGHVLLNEYLCVQNQSLAAEFGVPTDAVEYNWTKDDVDRVLTQADNDELLDALDFAPDGIKELIKDRAVQLQITDMSKRQAILDALGYDVTKAIEVNVASQTASTDSTSTEKQSSKQRRRAAKTDSE